MIDDGRRTIVRERRRALPGLSVRLAISKEEEALKALVAAVCAESTAPLLSARISPAHAFVAVQGEILVGFVSWAQDEMLGVMTGIGVRESHRRFGVASALLEAMAAHLREDGVRLLACSVQAPGVGALLERHRFRAVGAWVQMPGRLRCWMMPFDLSTNVEGQTVCVRYERRLLGCRRNLGDGFYA